MYHLLHSCSLVLLLFGLSLSTLQLSSSPDTNGSYCPGKVTFTCVGTNVPYGIGWKLNESIVYTYTRFGNQNESFSTFMVTVKSVSPSFATLNITLELSGNVSDLWQSTVSCRTITDESDTYYIFPSVPEIPDNIRVDPVYKFHTNSLSEIRVLWNTLNELCMDYSYQVMLTNGSSTLSSENVNCRRDTECQVQFMITMSQIFDRYIVHVVTFDFQGLAVNTSILPPIDYTSSILPNISIEFSTCFIKCYSDFNENETCKIEFPEGSVNGTVNSEDIQVPESLQSGTVHFNATFNIDRRTYTFQNSSLVQYNNKWRTTILALVVFTIFLCFLSIILIVPTGFCLYKRKDDIKRCLKCGVIIACTLLSIIFLAVSLIFWIVGLVEVNKTDCSSVDLPQNLLIPAFIFSFLTVIFNVAPIFIVVLCQRCTKSKGENKGTNEGNISANVHKRRGETSVDASLRINATSESNTYAKLRREVDHSSEYDDLNNDGTFRHPEYDALNNGSMQKKHQDCSIKKPGATDYDHINDVKAVDGKVDGQEEESN